jgi:integrase
VNKSKVPSYRKQKKPGGDLAFVKLDDQRIYLGRYGTPESRELYRQTIAEWLANNRQAPSGPELICMVELIAKYLAFAEDYYRHSDGITTIEGNNIKDALKPLKELYGQDMASDFGPLALKAVRERIIKKGWCRKLCNQQIGRIKRMFRWATENELIAPSIYHGLQAMAGLRLGRSEAHEAPPVTPVADAVVDATLPYMAPTVAAMVELQRLTGMRPGEVCIVRTCDVDTSGPIWVYRPEHHKMQYRGRSRQVFVGPKAQDMLRPWLRPDLTAYVFSPAGADQERREARHAARKTPASCGNRPGSHVKKDRGRPLGECYDTQAYDRAIYYACDLAFPPPEPLAKQAGETGETWLARLGDDGREQLRVWRREHRWSPNQLRHSFATRVRKEAGLEAAQILLGHARADVTQIYAETNRERGLMLAAKIG